MRLMKKIDFKNIDWLSLLKDYIVCTIGIFLFVFSWTAFLIPNEIAGGGVTGLSSIIFYATGIPISISYFVINAALFIIGTIILGKGFGFKTIFCVALASFFFEIFPNHLWVSEIDDQLLNAIIGGTLSGIGISGILLHGGSTGGTDILVLIINKYKQIPPGRLFLFFDLLIIGSYLFLPDKSIENIIYGYVVMVAFTYIIDMIINGVKQSLQIMIFSPKNDEIAKLISENIDRGVTVVHTQGWYSGQQNNAIMVVIRKNEMTELSKIVKSIDKTAFYTVTPTNAVYGKGFNIDK